MLALPTGKGFFIWKIWLCENGDPEAIADAAAAAGLGHVLIKVANGVWKYNIIDGIDLVPPVVAALKARGIQVWGWHYVFGDNPELEAEIANQRIEELGLDGYVIDAEAEYKRSGMATRAVTFLDHLHLNVPVALSSYRYPSVHPEFPWAVFLARVDFAMPQVYWIHGHNADQQLFWTLDEYALRAPGLPVIPTGAAFKEWGWSATPQDVLSFLLAAEKAKVPAVNFREWANCRSYLADCWQVVAEYDWEAGNPPPPPPSENGRLGQVADVNTVGGRVGFEEYLAMVEQARALLMQRAAQAVKTEERLDSIPPCGDSIPPGADN